MNSIIRNKYFQWSLILIFGIVLGKLMFSNTETTEKHEHSTKETESTIWTCSMHPQIRQDKPGKCPLCGMDLIPLSQTGGSVALNAIQLSSNELQLANIQTSIVKRENAEKEVRMYGKIESDERLIQTISSHVPGRIEKLLVDFTGDEVTKGQTIAEIYSPTLVQAQQELFEAKKLAKTIPAALEAAREKLRQWKLTDLQILEIEKTEKIVSNFEVKSTVSGIITKKIVNQGDYVSQGSTLYEVSDLSTVWILFDAYESDLPWIKKGDKVNFTLQSVPGKNFTANISFIPPIIDNVSRVAKVRIELENNGKTFKPGMFATGILNAKLDNFNNSIIIPSSAVLWTGTRSVVYVKLRNTQMPSFEMREIELGPELGSSFVVLSGLTEGEELVTNGVFNIDAAAQLAGKTSMMNNEISDSKTKLEEPIQMLDKSKIDAKFRTQFTDFYLQYLKMKDDFVTSDANLVGVSSKTTQKSVQNVNSELLTSDAKKKWISFADEFQTLLTTISKSTDIEVQRMHFSKMNEVLYKAIKTFGLKNTTAYYEFCPMALGDKGAYWFSDNSEIKNPYFGKKMLTCGEVKETIKNDEL